MTAHFALRRGPHSDRLPHYYRGISVTSFSNQNRCRRRTTCHDRTRRVRQDGALIGSIDSIDLAIDKAMTARLFDKTTSELATLAQSGEPLFGIQQSNSGKLVIFGGGVPIVSGGNIIGAVGTSAGTVEQDIEVA